MQIRGLSRGKCQYLLDSDKGQTKHLSSMSSLWRTTRISRWMTPTLTTVLIRPFLNLFCTNTLLLMFSGLCRSHSILHPQCVSKLIDIFDILFQTRVKMYLVRSFNWPLLYYSTMTACRLNASIFALSRSGTARLAQVPWPCLLWPGGCSFARPDPPQFGTRHYNRRRRKWYWAWRCCLPSLLPSWL